MISKNRLVPLEYEQFQEGDVPAFVSIVEVIGVLRVVVMDTVDEDNMRCYDLDKIVNLEAWRRDTLLKCINEWGARGDFKPVSLDFSRMNINHIAEDCLCVFPMDTIARVVSNTYSFNNAKTRKRRVMFPPKMSLYL